MPEASLFTPSFYEKSIRRALNIHELDLSGFRTQERLLANNCLRLDEGLDQFRLITEGLPLPRLGRPLGANLFSPFAPIAPIATKGDTWRIFELVSDYVPASLVRHIVEHGELASQGTEISMSTANWGVLEDLRKLINVRDMKITMRLIHRSELNNGHTSSTFGKPIFHITTHRGTTFTHDQLSYGEKRLLAFMYHAAANPQILVADELVNGMHYEWIDACLAVIQGQAFLTSQNPLLLDHLSFESAEEVQRRFVLCDSDENGNWIWRNMDLDTADAFYRAYEVGLQHVGEILRTSGPW